MKPAAHQGRHVLRRVPVDRSSEEFGRLGIQRTGELGNDFETDVVPMAYPAAIALVALIGSFNTLHSADRFSARGRQ